jgi:hypothetical protein
MTVARATDARLAHLLATDDLSEDDREAIEDEIVARFFASNELGNYSEEN